MSRTSGQYKTLKNGVVINDPQYGKAIEILCEPIHARVLLGLAKVIYPDAARSIPTPPPTSKKAFASRASLSAPRLAVDTSVPPRQFACHHAGRYDREVCSFQRARRPPWISLNCERLCCANTSESRNFRIDKCSGFNFFNAARSCFGVGIFASSDVAQARRDDSKQAPRVEP